MNFFKNWRSSTLSYHGQALQCFGNIQYEYIGHKLQIKFHQKSG